MAGPPPPPPPAQWPLSLVTPACYNRILGMGADNWASQYSRPNSEILFSTPFPTCEVGYSWPYGSFGVGPYSYDCYHYQCVIPVSLPSYQVQIQKNGYDSLQHGTGVFHPSRVSTEYRRAHYNNIKGRRIRQVGGREDNGNCENGRGENSSKGKKKKEECHNLSRSLKNESKEKKKNKKNDGPMKKEEEEEECHDPSLPHTNGSKGKKEKKKNKKKNGGSEKKEEECYVPNLPPGIVLPMEWPYPDSF